LAQALIGSGVTISNPIYKGANIAAGTFAGGTNIIGFENGVILSSGNIASVIGPNGNDAITTVNGTAGDVDLNTLSGYGTNDASVLEFDFIPNADKVYFRYVFSSDEYNEFVNSPYNDVFGFFINNGSSTVNCAVVGVSSDPVSINTINNGNPFGSGGMNSNLYINNDLSDGGGTIDTEMDGLTVVLTCEANVTANAVNHIKLAIADASDSSWDSNVFIEKNSFTTKPPSSDTCPLSQGYWKNHAENWLPNTIILGGQSYDKEALLDLLTMPVQGDASIILAKQLIAAKLNIANGSSETAIKDIVADADSLITAKLPMGIKPSSVNGKKMTNDATKLDDYNHRLLTPNCTTLDKKI
jgi:hypothetical protein